ncbi:MAG: HAMP domain-containing protein [Acidobacteriota bacterium]|nr:HAMP domain-containing protein [Acidobacteriota bacterium]
MPDRIPARAVPSLPPPPRPWLLRRLARIAITGGICAVLVLLAGAGLERWRFGPSDATMLARVERDVRGDFTRMTAQLRQSAAALAGQRAVLSEAARDTAAVRNLFAAASAALPAADASELGLTIYDATGRAIAWSGRSTEIPQARIDGPSALFVAPGPLGNRLVYVLPLFDQPARGRTTPARRVGTVVAERLLTPSEGMGAVGAGTFTLQTSLVPVTLRARYEGAGAASTPDSFMVSSADGTPLVEAHVAPAALQQARTAWRRAVATVALVVLALALLLCALPLLDWRARLRRPCDCVAASLAVALVVLAGRALLWIAVPRAWRGAPIPATTGSVLADAVLLRSPLDLLLTALMLVTLAMLAFDLVEQRRLAIGRGHHLFRSSGGRLPLMALAAAAASLAVAGLVILHQRFLEVAVAATAPDPLHFSLTTLDGRHLVIAAGLTLLSVAVVWAGALLLRLVGTTWRLPRHDPARIVAGLAWALPVAGLVATGTLRRAPGGWPALVVVTGCALLALLTTRAVRWHRRTSQAAGFGILLLALVIPPVLLYPSVLAYANQARETAIRTRYGPEAAQLRDRLKQQLHDSLDQIDALSWLPDLTTAAAAAGDTNNLSADSAFLVWSHTDLATHRLTSAIELYGPSGALVSRFALNLPEYAAASQPWHPTRCQWDLFEEVAPFGSTERRILHAGRALCVPDGHGGVRRAGAIVVHVMLDYNTLPFISSHNPYFELLRATPGQPPATNEAHDLEFLVYGWSGSPMYASGTTVWTLPAPVFARLVASRQPFWTQVSQNGQDWRLYLLSDRGGIYALGYPLVTPFGHLLNLAQLSILVVVLYALLLLARGLAFLLVRREPATGHGLLREIRASFYRKLFWAFVGMAVVPVLILAVATRTYIATQLRAGIESAAARTAAVAQNVVDDYLDLQQRGTGAVPVLDDDVLVWLGRVIDQDVNVFSGSRLLATSERDLFASGVLPTRTPANVYRAIVLRRLPSFVGDETVGGFRYIVAAAPVHAGGGRDGIVTVPLTLRQQEIERQIDELDRRVIFAILLFSLLGAAAGYWMAERIADPVNRLTRATRRIARGDLDARIAVTSSDELRRLVQDFNRMAADLKAQRAELAHTQRLAAWADMARQVAHDIKNPLTPIQLSAEHLRRVHADRHAPLGPVFDECLDTILTQVRLLREIAGEFSSFASSPATQLAPTSLGELVAEVVTPYRLGLSGRIDVTIDVPDALPPLQLDRLLLSRALANVIENAVSAMPARGHLRISAERLSGQPWVALHVEDDGVGMDPEAVRRAFEPYFSTKKTGTGLGMTIARRNVEANGGTIALSSERGHGTRVTIRLPLGDQPAGRSS